MFQPITAKLDDVIASNIKMPVTKRRQLKTGEVPNYGIDIDDEVPDMNLGDLFEEPVLTQQEKQLVPRPPTYEESLISGLGVKTGGFIIPPNRINELMPYANWFTTKQQRDYINALQMGKGMQIKPTKMLSGGFLGTLLASVGIPLAVEPVKKLFSRSRAPRTGQKAFIKSRGRAAPQIGLPKMPFSNF